MPHISEPYNKIGEIILSNKSGANDTDISPHSFMADLIAKTGLSSCDAKVWLARVQHSLEKKHYAQICVICGTCNLATFVHSRILCPSNTSGFQHLLSYTHVYVNRYIRVPSTVQY